MREISWRIICVEVVFLFVMKLYMKRDDRENVYICKFQEVDRSRDLFDKEPIIEMEVPSNSRLETVVEEFMRLISPPKDQLIESD